MNSSKIVDLGVGYTTLHKANRLSKVPGLKSVYVKDDTVNPTYSFKDRILNSSGKPRRLLNFFVNGKNTRFLKNLETSLKDDAEFSILPIVSGG